MPNSSSETKSQGIELEPTESSKQVADSTVAVSSTSPTSDSHPYLDVLMSDFQMVREANNYRDQFSLALFSFMLLILTAAFAFVGDIIVTNGNEVLLLVVSLVFSLLGLLYLSIQYVQQELQVYEHSEIRPKVERYLAAIHRDSDPEFEPVLTLQEWYSLRLKKVSVLGKITKASTIYTPLVFSLGALAWFLVDHLVEYGNLWNLSILEIVAIVPAIIFASLYILAVVRHFIIYSRRPQWRAVEKQL